MNLLRDVSGLNLEMSGILLNSLLNVFCIGTFCNTVQ